MAVASKKKNQKLISLLEEFSSLERYAKELFSFLPLPVCVMSALEIILEVNPAFERVTGYKIEEAIGKPITKIFNKTEIESVLEEAKKRETIYAREIELITKDKVKIPVSLSVSLRKGERGEIIGFFLCFFDLREIKSTQKRLEEKIKELEKFQKVAVRRELRMIELKKEIKKLKEKIKNFKGYKI
jgi:PAS domain S-box-containing protein